MNSRDTTYLEHIREAIEKIDLYLDGVTEEQFSQTSLVRDAVLRNLEVISEASRRLSDELKGRHELVPWSNIAGAGNIYRHNYATVDVGIVWQTATAGLSVLRDVLTKEL